MTLPRLIHRSLTHYSCFYHGRGASRTWSSLSGSRFVSSPVDDKENASVISDLLVYERRRELKKSVKNKENIVDTKTKNTLVKRKTPDNERIISKCNQEKDDNQTEIMHLMKLVKNKYSCYIIGQDAAETLVKHVKEDLKEGDVIAEGNLGAGILTSALLSQTSHKVVGYETNLEFLLPLRDQYQQYSSRLELHCLDIFKFYWYYTLNKREPDREGDADKLACLLDPLPVRGAQEVSPVKIVSSVCDMSFFHNLTLSFTFQCCFYKEIFPVFYIYISEEIFGHLTSSSRNIISRKLRLPFIYYFNLEHLDTAPKSSFYSARFKKKKNKKKNENIFHLVKITPKKNVQEIVPKQELEKFHYFIRCMNNAKSAESLIFQMEKWIPGCGIDYIKNGFRMFTHPRQLTQEQLFEAYRLFISLPSFKECMFHHLCENWTIQYGLKDGEIPLKVETEIIDDGDVTDRDVDDDDQFVDKKKTYKSWTNR